MSPVRLNLIVTGHGESVSVPILVRRIAGAVQADVVVDVAEVLRVPESSLRKEGQLERHVERASRLLQGSGGILVLLDRDWEGGCPAIDGPNLLLRAQSICSDKKVLVLIQA